MLADRKHIEVSVSCSAKHCTARPSQLWTPVSNVHLPPDECCSFIDLYTYFIVFFYVNCLSYVFVSICSNSTLPKAVSIGVYVKPPEGTMETSMNVRVKRYCKGWIHVSA